MANEEPWSWARNGGMEPTIRRLLISGEMGHDDLWPVNETRHWSRSLGRRLRGGAGLTLPLGVAVNLDGLIWGGESTARGKVWRWEKSRLALVAVWEPRPLSMPPM